MDNLQNPNPPQQRQTIIVKSTKSEAVAVLLALFFGPLGMLYASVKAAVIMFIISCVVAFFSLGLGLLLTIPAGAIWAYMEVKNYNEDILRQM